jgi:hypothetical protein
VPRRPFFTLFAALSLFLCVAVCVLWVLSYQTTFAPGIWLWEVQVFDGRIRFLYDGTFQNGENAMDLWVPALLSGAMPLLWAAGRWRRPRVGGGCLSCGYDLRATPERCPECGRAAGMERSKQFA